MEQYTHPGRDPRITTITEVCETEQGKLKSECVREKERERVGEKREEAQNHRSVWHLSLLTVNGWRVFWLILMKL